MEQQNDFLINIKKQFYNKFYTPLRKSPYCTIIEIYDNIFRINCTRKSKIYYNIINYCIEKCLIYDGLKITLANGEERFKLVISF